MLNQKARGFGMSDVVIHKNILPPENYVTMRVRIPKFYEHPLTLDVKANSTPKEDMSALIKLWEAAIKDAGTIYRHELTDYQKEVIDNFWSSIPDYCKVDVIPESVEKIVLKYTYEGTTIPYGYESDLKEVGKPVPQLEDKSIDGSSI